jgi:S-adenosylmethionine hydrolase
LPQPESTHAGTLIAHVMHVDRFGNLILDATADDVHEESILELGGHRITGLSHTFADVEPGEMLAYVGSSRNHVEIAVREGSAAQKLNVGVGDEVLIGQAK